MTALLFQPYDLAGTPLRNRIAMAPMTRARNPGTVANALTAQYYRQRASAGLIISEGTPVSAQGQGYIDVPGMWSAEQVEGWKHVTAAVHAEHGAIFAQLWHVGRMSHASLQPDGGQPVSAGTRPVASNPKNTSFVYHEDGSRGHADPTPPRALRTDELPGIVDDFARAADNAIAAGFDGIELHAANGYLFEQFMNSVLNTRTDPYGGQSPENRTRLLLEVVDAAIGILGEGRVGIRLSPFGRYGSMPLDPKVEETLFYLCNELNRRGIAYLHLLYQLMPSGNAQDSSFNESHLSHALLGKLRDGFTGSIIWCGGFDGATAQAALDSGLVDLIAFGRPFIANPDLVERLQHDWPLTEADRSAYYTRDGKRGYTDFPAWEPAAVPVG